MPLIDDNGRRELSSFPGYTGPPKTPLEELQDIYEGPVRRAGLLDVAGAQGSVAEFEQLSTSAPRFERQPIVDQLRKLHRLDDPDPLSMASQKAAGGFPGVNTLELKRQLEAREGEIKALRAAHPERGFQTAAELQEQLEEESARRQALLRDAKDRAGPLAGLFGTLLGGSVVLTDPINMATWPAAAGKAAGILRTALFEAGVGAASEATVQATSVYDWRKRIKSPDAGLKSSMIDIATGAAGGFLIGGGVASISAGGRLVKRSLSQGTELADAFSDGLKSGALELTPELEAAHTVLRDMNEVERMNPFPEDGPAGAQRHIAKLQRAQEQVLAGETVDVDSIGPIRESSPADAPPDVKTFDPSDIKRDPERFQFKSAADVTTGETTALKGVTVFDPHKAGIVHVWEEASTGDMFVVDGHQRHALALRAQEGGQADVKLLAQVYREADGYTAEAVRVRAAARNLAEGSGSPLDAAKLMRSVDPVAIAETATLPPTSALVRDGRGLAKLGDDAFTAVVNRVVPERWAAHVGRLIDDPGEQLAAIGVLKRANPANGRQAEIMVESIREAGFEKKQAASQMSLLGDEDFTESLFAERARVIDAAINRIKRDKALFNSMVENAAALEDAGNVLARDNNLARLSQDELALAQFVRLANSKGPIGEAATSATRRMKNGEITTKQAADELLEAVRKGDGGTSTDPGLPEPAKGAPVAVAGLPPQDQLRVKQSFTAGQSAWTFEQVAASAKKHHRKLATQAKRIAKELGVEPLLPPLKNAARAAEKIEGKGYVNMGQLTDMSRVGFVAKTPAEADAIVAALSKSLEVLDEGWNRLPPGWMDRRLLVRFEDGHIGEVQIRDPNLHAAKAEGQPDGGEALFKKARALMEGGGVRAGAEAEYEALMGQMQALYRAAIEKSDPAMREVYEIGGSPATSRKSANASRQASSLSSRPESATSRGDAPTQDAPTSGTKTAARKTPGADESATAGRPSQSIKDSANASTSNSRIPDEAPQLKDEIVDTQLDAIQRAQLDEVLERAELAGEDLNIPTGEFDADGEMVFRSAREVLGDIDTEGRKLDFLVNCING